MVTQREVATHAGVSLSVVSAVVNDTVHTRMSSDTRARVQTSMAGLGYLPNQAARAVRLQRTGMIAVIVRRLDVPMYSPMIKGLHDVAARHGSSVLLGDAAMMRSGSQFLARLLGNGTVDGIAVRGIADLDADVAAALQRRPTPLLILDRPEDDHLPWISVDDRAAAACATDHLLGLGHRRIAFAGGGPCLSTDLRYAGYVDRMRARGLRPMRQLVPLFGVTSGAAVISELHRRRSRVTAVVMNNVVGAVGLLAAAHDTGVRVPDDLSVIALHDMPMAAYARPAITTVRMPMYELGVQAADALHAMINGDPPELGVVATPAPVVVERASAAAHAGP